MSARIAGQYRWLPEGVWEIEAAPDVMMRIKRWFPRVDTTCRGTVTVTGTDEVARDLEMIVGRHPMRASVQDRRRLQEMAAAHRRSEAAVARLMSGETLSVGEGPGWVTPAVPLRHYQRIARDLVWASGGTLIADDLGAGKTFTSLALLEQPEARPALAVTLTGVMGQQWREQLAEFYPTLTSVEVQTGEMHSLKVRGRVADLIVMNYAKLDKWQYRLKGLVRTVIFDETQELRRSDSNRYKAAMNVASEARFRIGITNTPVFNYGGSEIYNIIDALRPGVLGSRDEFAREWCNTSSLHIKSMVANPVALNSHLKAHGLLLRRTLEEVGIELPPLYPIEQPVPSDPKVLAEIEGNAVELARLILDQSANPRERWSAAGQFDWMMRQQTGIAKAPFVADFVKMVLQSQQRVILLGWHHACHRIWMEQLADYEPMLYTGEQTNAQKARSIAAFKNGSCRVLIMSVRSGAGVDGLQQVASTLVFGELDWSPGPHKQAMGRLHRPGQTVPTMAYFCVTDSGSDPIMVETLDLKQMQADGILDPDSLDADPRQGQLEPHIERYDQIKRIAANYLAGIDQQSSQRRSA